MPETVRATHSHNLTIVCEHFKLDSVNYHLKLDKKLNIFIVVPNYLKGIVEISCST